MFTVKHDWLIVGQFGRVHGVHGFIAVRSFTEPWDQLLSYIDWHVRLHVNWQKIYVTNILHTKKGRRPYIF